MSYITFFRNKTFDNKKNIFCAYLQRYNTGYGILLQKYTPLIRDILQIVYDYTKDVYRIALENLEKYIYLSVFNIDNTLYFSAFMSHNYNTVLSVQGISTDIIKYVSSDLFEYDSKMSYNLTTRQHNNAFLDYSRKKEDEFVCNELKNT